MDEEHPDIELARSNFRVEITGNQAMPLGRQAEEGVLLLEELREVRKANSAPPRRVERGGGRSRILNSRGEFHQPLGGVKVTTSYL